MADPANDGCFQFFFNPDHPPRRGESFTFADHTKFAGHKNLIAEMVARLTAPDDPIPLLFVTGASGSGKSACVPTGVFPAREQHDAALSVNWAVFRVSGIDHFQDKRFHTKETLMN